MNKENPLDAAASEMRTAQYASLDFICCSFFRGILPWYAGYSARRTSVLWL